MTFITVVNLFLIKLTPENICCIYSDVHCNAAWSTEERYHSDGAELTEDSGVLQITISCFRYEQIEMNSTDVHIYYGGLDGMPAVMEWPTVGQCCDVNGIYVLSMAIKQCCSQEIFICEHTNTLDWLRIIVIILRPTHVLRLESSNTPD
jgi:hypothetical protein